MLNRKSKAARQFPPCQSLIFLRLILECLGSWLLLIKEAFLGEDDPKILLNEVVFLILQDQLSVDWGIFCFQRYLGATPRVVI